MKWPTKFYVEDITCAKLMRERRKLLTSLLQPFHSRTKGINGIHGINESKELLMKVKGLAALKAGGPLESFAN